MLSLRNSISIGANGIQGANVNLPPTGYELLKDSDGSPIKDSDGQFIYVLKS